MFSIINSPTNWHAQSNNETVQTSEPKPKERKANRKKHKLRTKRKTMKIYARTQNVNIKSVSSDSVQS